ncbi:hypothetical protein [Streptomyces sp. NPDC056661]|uniref:hypothetical protein n=1 Tax=Streptomyces sp. NPDC056661 TaxID=3345898 RepID=UPI003697EC34
MGAADNLVIGRISVVLRLLCDGTVTGGRVPSTLDGGTEKTATWDVSAVLSVVADTAGEDLTWVGQPMAEVRRWSSWLRSRSAAAFVDEFQKRLVSNRVVDVHEN